MHFYFFQLVQLISLITAIICFKGIKHFKLTAFIPLLLIICIIEALASNCYVLGWKSNYVVYNLYFVISTPFLLYLTYNMLLYKGYLKVVYILLSSLLMVFILFNTFFLQGLYALDSYSYMATEFVMAILSFLVIARLFFEDDTSIMLNKHPYFWISASTVIFAIGALFIMGLSHYIQAKSIEINGLYLYRYVMPVLNYVLYLSYIYAFILCRKLTSKLY
jgi:hypothetical protein